VPSAHLQAVNLDPKPTAEVRDDATFQGCRNTRTRQQEKPHRTECATSFFENCFDHWLFPSLGVLLDGGSALTAPLSALLHREDVPKLRLVGEGATAERLNPAEAGREHSALRVK
jgi:hypothetical protein